MSALPADILARSAAPARADAPVLCAHCALPVPRGLVRPEAAEQFCCHACETARTAIRACGLDRFYEYLRADGASPRPASSTGAAYDEYDDPVFHRLHVSRAGPELLRATLVSRGLHCAACVWLLERLPRVAPGVVEARVDLSRGQITLLWREGEIALSAAARAMDRLGYPSWPLRGANGREARVRETRQAVQRIGVAGALFGNTMLLAISLYAGLFTGIDGRFSLWFRCVSAGLALASICWPGRVFFRGAIASLRVGALHMDVPIALALLIGMAHGASNTARGAGEVYFDTICTLVFLLLIGRFIQSSQQRRAADAIEAMFHLTPSRAVRVDAGAERAVPIEALREGDLVAVAPGESIPVDGLVEAGASAVDSSLLTGESRPAPVGPGASVVAGSVNLASRILVRAAAAGEATRLAALMRLVEDHAHRRPAIVRAADRVVAWFVAAVLLCAAVTAAIWWRAGAAAAVEHAVALLIITCPCALGLATPLAVVVGIGRAARRGILIKGGDALESLAGKGTIVFDKTGTLTTGSPRVERYAGPAHLKPLIAAAERSVNHPLARAIAEAFSGEDGQEPESVAHSLGGGVEAHVEGVSLIIGSPAFVLSRLSSGARLPLPLERAIADAARDGLTPVLAAADGAPTAVIALGDTIREDAAASIGALRGAGWRPLLLSGDDPRVAAAVGASLGLGAASVVGGATPESKAARIAALAATGPVVMVGDGVNDAAALAAATVGVAVHGGAEAALAAADVYLSRPGLAGLVDLVRGARGVTRVIRRNLAVSLGYNAVFVALAMAGLVSPLVAAVLMPISSVTVAVLSFRNRAFAEPAAGGARWR